MIPIHNLWRYKADDADINRNYHAAAIGFSADKTFIDDGVGIEDRLLAGDANDVGQHDREARRATVIWFINTSNAKIFISDLAQKIQAIIEFMVANTGAIEFQGIHCFVYRQCTGAGDRGGDSLLVTQ